MGNGSKNQSNYYVFGPKMCIPLAKSPCLSGSATLLVNNNYFFSFPRTVDEATAGRGHFAEEKV
jgi:hypothetical protein